MKTIHQDRYATLIKTITAIRQEKNLTQVQLADKLGKPQSFIAKVEGLDRKLDIIEFVDWCTAIEIKASDLIKEKFESDHIF